MKKRFKRILALVLVITLMNTMVSQTALATSVPQRETDVSSELGLIALRGNFYAESKEKVLKRINEIRKEACEEGVINVSSGKPLTPADYKPIKWSSALEWIAQTRAAEASVCQGHTRPNGTDWFTCTADGQRTWAENLAWNWTGMMEGIEQWYDEKDDWVKQNKSAVTGHYTSMINPSYNHIALGCFSPAFDGVYAVSAEFSLEKGLNEDAIGVSGLYDQLVEIPTSEMEQYSQYTVNDGSAAPTRETTVSSALALITIRGSFETVAKDTVLKRINKIRKEACEEGIINPDTGNALTSADYKPIKWSSDLEWIAQTRAAEISVRASHTRPNGKSCFSCSRGGETSWSESSSFNCFGLMETIERWYLEKEDWVEDGKESGASHYTALINPQYNHIAFGSFSLGDDGWYAVACEFSTKSGLNEDAIGVSGLYDQVIEVPISEMNDYLENSGQGESTSGTAPQGESKPSHNHQSTLPCTKKLKVKVKKTTATVTWKKNKKGKGYQIQYSTSKKFSSGVKMVTIKKNKTVKTTVKKLKKGKVYYFRIRTVKGKEYSDWSKVQKVKVKKK